MITLTITDLPIEFIVALAKESERRGKNINDTARLLLSESVNLDRPPGRWTNGLEKLAGRWTEEEFQEFERNTAETRKIDESMWK